MRHVRILGLLASFVALIAAVPIQTSQTSDAYVRTWLRDTMGFSASDVRDVTEGRAVARQLKLAGPEEVSIFGAVRIAVGAGRVHRSAPRHRGLRTSAGRAASGKVSRAAATGRPRRAHHRSRRPAGDRELPAGGLRGPAAGGHDQALRERGAVERARRGRAGQSTVPPDAVRPSSALSRGRSRGHRSVQRRARADASRRGVSAPAGHEGSAAGLAGPRPVRDGLSGAGAARRRGLLLLEQGRVRHEADDARQSRLGVCHRRGRRPAGWHPLRGRDDADLLDALLQRDVRTANRRGRRREARAGVLSLLRQSIANQRPHRVHRHPDPSDRQEPRAVRHGTLSVEHEERHRGRRAQEGTGVDLHDDRHPRPDQAVRQAAALRRRVLPAQSRRESRAGRAERLGQDDALPDDRRRGDGRRRRRVAAEDA